MVVFKAQLHGHFITDSRQDLISKEGLGEQWGSRAAGRRALRAGGRYGTVEQQADYDWADRGENHTHTHTHTQNHSIPSSRQR
jgi:hypothetical protein